MKSKFGYILENFKKNQSTDYISWLNDMSDVCKYDIDMIDILETWRPKIGLYAGSFNPFHKGHLNIIMKAEEIFDKVIIARGINPTKKNEIFELPESIKDRQIEYFDGLLTNFMDNLGYEVTLIRGLRNATDLQYELTQFKFLQEMKPDIKIVNIFCDKDYEHISSSAIRGLLQFKTGEQYMVK